MYIIAEAAAEILQGNNFIRAVKTRQSSLKGCYVQSGSEIKQKFIKFENLSLIMDKHIKNVGLGIISFLVVVGFFKLANIVADAKFYVIILLLLLIYFELWDKK